MDSEKRIYLTRDLIEYIHSGLEVSEWKKFIEEKLSDTEYDISGAEAITKILELDIDWNSVSADDPELIKQISKKTGLIIPDVRLAASIISDAYKAKPDTEYPWLIRSFPDPCLGQRQFVVGANYKHEESEILTVPPFLISVNYDDELICNPVIGTYQFNFCRMESLCLPYTVRFVNAEDFLGCYRLKTITVDPSNEHYSADEQGLLYNKDGTILKYIPNGKERIFINKNVECIDENLIDLYSGNFRSDIFDEFGGDWDKLLKFIEVDRENPWLKSDENGVLYDWEGNVLITPPCTEPEDAEGKYKNCKEEFEDPDRLVNYLHRLELEKILDKPIITDFKEQD